MGSGWAVAFWVSLLFVAYTYLGYPAAIALLAHLCPRPVRRDAVTPSVSLVIAVRNERARLAAKLRNVFELDYPQDRLQVVVALDGSDEETEAIAREHEAAG